jgi:hypothetical protein
MGPSFPFEISMNNIMTTMNGKMNSAQNQIRYFLLFELPFI